MVVREGEGWGTAAAVLSQGLQPFKIHREMLSLFFSCGFS